MKPLKVKDSGAEARAEGPFLKWQNHSGKAAKALGERADLRASHPRPEPGVANERQL